MFKLTHVQSVVILACCLTAFVLLVAFYLMLERRKKDERKMLAACDAQIAHLNKMLELVEAERRLTLDAWWASLENLDSANRDHAKLFDSFVGVAETGLRILNDADGMRTKV